MGQRGLVRAGERKETLLPFSFPSRVPHLPEAAIFSCDLQWSPTIPPLQSSLARFSLSLARSLSPWLAHSLLSIKMAKLRSRLQELHRWTRTRMLRLKHAEGDRSSSVSHEMPPFAAVEAPDAPRRRWSLNADQQLFFMAILGAVVFSTISSSIWFLHSWRKCLDC